MHSRNSCINFMKFHISLSEHQIDTSGSIDANRQTKSIYDNRKQANVIEGGANVQSR